VDGDGLSSATKIFKVMKLDITAQGSIEICKRGNKEPCPPWLSNT
jgi:phosphotransferase system HPr-like phosphotransfer protein